MSHRACCPNPALSLTPITLYEAVKIALFTITLIAPARFIMVWALVLVGWLLARLELFMRARIRDKYITEAIHRMIFAIISRGTRCILYAAGFWYIPVSGAPDPRARLFIATHTSLWDSLWLLSYVGTTQAAKTELFDTPILGDLLRVLDSLPVDRNSVHGRRTAISEIKRRSAVDSRFPPLLIFPTASCTNARQLIHFKRGAFEAGCPIQPVGIAYPSRHYDMKLSPRVLWDMYRAVCQVYNVMAITFLPIRFPSESERLDAILFSENVREEMGIKLGMQLVDIRLEDEIIRTLCRDMGVFHNETKLRIHNFRMTEKCLDSFALIDRDRDGWISLEDLRAFRMAAAEGVPSSVTEGEFGEILARLKLPPIPLEEYGDRRNFPNYDSWTESGVVGLLSGGRPRLAPRLLDAYHPDKLEFAEIITYLNDLLLHPARETKRFEVLLEMFGVREFFVV